MFAFVDPNLNATKAQDFITLLLKIILSGDAGFITAQNFAFTEFLVLPEFAFAGRAFDCQHPMYVSF
jgi:hypothetical protein